MLFRFIAPVLAASMLAAGGCGAGKLNETRTFELLVSGDANAIDLPAQSSVQRITVEFTSSNTEVTTLIFREADAKGEEGLTDSDPALALAKETAKSGSFTAEVPANTPTRVIVRGAIKKTSVELKVTNRR